MKCEQCRALVEDYLDGELDRTVSERVGAHIANCGACAGLAAGIRREHEVYALYSRDVDVTPALWATVQARIAEERRTEEQKHGRFAGLWEWLRAGSVAPRLSPRLAVALVVVAIGITVGVMSYLQSQNQGSRQVARDTDQPGAGDTKDHSEPAIVKGVGPDAVDLPPSVKDKQPGPFIATKKRPAASDPDRLVREAEQKYRAAIGILERGLKDRRRQLDPETRAQFDIALASIDQTIEATRVAARGNPADPIAVGYLLAAYSKKVDFLRDTARDETEVNRPF